MASFSVVSIGSVFRVCTSFSRDLSRERIFAELEDDPREFVLRERPDELGRAGLRRVCGAGEPHVERGVGVTGAEAEAARRIVELG